jgi:hypothetical protein
VCKVLVSRYISFDGEAPDPAESKAVAPGTVAKKKIDRESSKIVGTYFKMCICARQLI